MIKINLATRKQTIGVRTNAGTLSGLTGGMNFNFDLKILRDRSLGKPIVYIVLSAALWFGWSWYQDQELSRIDVEIVQYETENKGLRAELDKSKGYEQVKKALDQDEETLRAKINVISKLVTGRQDPPKTLIGLATGIPTEVWIDTFTADEATMKIHGVALSFENVSDFMKNLGESAFFSDVRLVESRDTLLEGSLHGVEFNLSARKK